MTDDIKQKLIAAGFPQALVEEAEVYAPAIARMAFAELTALAALIADKLTEKAQEAIRAKMSLDELAAEKTRLADLTVLMANNHAERLAAGNAILMALLKVAFAVAIGAAGF